MSSHQDSELNNKESREFIIAITEFDNYCNKMAIEKAEHKLGEIERRFPQYYNLWEYEKRYLNGIRISERNEIRGFFSKYISSSFIASTSIDKLLELDLLLMGREQERIALHHLIWDNMIKTQKVRSKSRDSGKIGFGEKFSTGLEIEQSKIEVGNEYIDIHLNRFNTPPLEDFDLDSHFRLLGMYIWTFLSMGYRTRLFIHNIPLGGNGWPSGDPLLLMHKKYGENFKQTLMNAIKYLLRKHPLINQLHNRIQIINLKNDNDIGKTLRSNIKRIGSEITSIKPPVATFSIACVTGVPFFYYLRKYKSCRNYVVLPCVNNRVRELPDLITAVLSPSPKQTLSNKPIYPWGCPYIDLPYKGSSLAVNRSISDRDRFIETQPELTSEIILIGTKNAKSFYSKNDRHTIDRILKSKTRKTGVTIVGWVESAENEILYDNLEHYFGDRILKLPFINGLESFLEKISRSPIRTILCVPPLTSGSGEAVTLCANAGIASVVNSPNDISQVIGEKNLSKDIEEYYNNLCNLILCSENLYKANILEVQRAIEVTNRYNEYVMRYLLDRP
ncbi:hypothetical protein [Synechococcus sp. MU1642]|uniref:hypothetical protein n=1 Tax=Synechococcus sp. MU1642 TaxID=2508348 RepID=UPI001CF895A3|nr:hypothetical protein [Synechococcus sp. MU1642]MCB4406918.1 hypothetical protein [Synechococcus sp. MU1642]